MNMHPTAIVHPKANIGEDVTIGPYCVIGEYVIIGDQTELASHVCIEGHTEIGRCCRISPFVSIGTPPQHLQYRDEPTKVSIGDHNVIRENVTINRGTEFGHGTTRIGHHNFLMAYTHVAHDCDLGDHIVMANAANLAGHVSVGNWVVIGGLVGVHQYVRIGEYSMVGGCSALGRDVPPFVRAAGGYRAQMFGLNMIGLRRSGFSAVRMETLKSAFELLFRQGHRLQEAIKLAKNDYGESTDVLSLLTFLESTSRGICQVSSRELDDDEE